MGTPSYISNTTNIADSRTDHMHQGAAYYHGAALKAANLPNDYALNGMLPYQPSATHSPALKSTVAAVAAPQKPTKEKDDHKRTAPMSRGEKVFDELTYGGVGWLTNAGVSAGLAYGMVYSDAGKPKFNKAVKWVNEKIGRPEIKGAIAESKTFGNMKLASLMAGGFALLIPITYLENHKTDLVKYFNNKYGSGLDQDTEQKSVDEMDHEPKQTGWTEFGGRSIAIGSVLLGEDKLGHKEIGKWGTENYNLGKLISNEKLKNFRIYEDGVFPAGDKLTKLMKKPLEETGKMRNFNHLLSEDVLIGAIYAGIMYGSTRMLGKAFGDTSHHEEKNGEVTIPEDQLPHSSDMYRIPPTQYVAFGEQEPKRYSQLSSDAKAQLSTNGKPAAQKESPQSNITPEGGRAAMLANQVSLGNAAPSLAT